MMKLNWKTISAIVAALLLTLGSGWLQGTMTQRWGFSESMDSAVETLDRLPPQFGSWQREQEFELGESAIEMLSCQGYIHRGYRNIETGDYIKLAVMVGPGSKMSIHIPEICFEASNYTLIEPRQQFDVSDDQRDHAFWGVTFRMNDVTQRKVRVLYGWLEDESWLAPQMPRWSVAGAPVLYKLQMSHTLSSTTQEDVEARDEMTREFLRHVVEAIGQFDTGNASDQAS